MLDVVRYPQKTYASRIDLPDGSYVDISAYGRTDVPGVIVAYYHTTAEYARNYTLTIQGSLAGYNTRDDGVIVVANGDRIIASNDEELADTKVEDSRILQQIKSESFVRRGRTFQVRWQHLFRRSGPQPRLLYLRLCIRPHGSD